METTKFSGGVPMVRIDGMKVRTLRETKGLTQLFLATSVGVTTDTISRWENKRYPTIKKENGLKLAEALEVELAMILEDEEAAEPETLPEGGAAAAAETIAPLADPAPAPAPPASPAPSPASPAPPAKRFPPTLLFALGGLVILFVLLWRLYPAPEQPVVSAVRRLPVQAVAGQPFPVAISVTSSATAPVSLIIKEKLPPGAKLLSAVPAPSAYDEKSGEVKWLLKIDGSQLFAYTVKIPAAAGPVSFDGTVAVPKGAGQPGPVRGGTTCALTGHHWADADADGRISDEEILTVYDVFNGLKGLEINIDQVEEIWLGSGYEWNSERKKFDVFP